MDAGKSRSDAPRRSGAGRSVRPRAADDAFWLGGAAMVAPGCVAAPREAPPAARGEDADPDWRVL